MIEELMSSELFNRVISNALKECGISDPTALDKGTKFCFVDESGKNMIFSALLKKPVRGNKTNFLKIIPVITHAMDREIKFIEFHSDKTAFLVCAVTKSLVDNLKKKFQWQWEIGHESKLIDDALRVKGSLLFRDKIPNVFS